MRVWQALQHHTYICMYDVHSRIHKDICRWHANQVTVRFDCGLFGRMEFCTSVLVRFAMSSGSCNQDLLDLLVVLVGAYTEKAPNA